MKQVDLQELYERCSTIHQNKYFYDFSNFKNVHSKITIICPQHGHFQQIIANHLYKNKGCPKCGQEIKKQKSQKRALTTEEFIKKAQKIHRNKYDYSIVNYINYDTPVQIICKYHGIFEKTPREHISKNYSGCNICAKQNSVGGYNEKYFLLFPEKKEVQSTLYVVKGFYKHACFLKVGITTQSNVLYRFKNVKNKFNLSILYEKVFPLYQSFLYEQQIIQQFSNKKFYFNKFIDFDGKTECFVYSDQLFNDIKNFLENLK